MVQSSADDKIKGREQKNQKVSATEYSQAVTHPSTTSARRCLTSMVK
jgi:hypothetical protein